jgi:hypothetical protein
MKRLTAVAGVGTVVICAAFAAAAKPSTSVERSLRMVTDTVMDDVLTQPWTILLPGMPARKGRIESAADGRTRLRCREGKASEIFGCASNNRNPIDRQIRLMASVRSVPADRRDQGGTRPCRITIET